MPMIRDTFHSSSLADGHELIAESKSSQPAAGSSQTHSPRHCHH